MVKKKILSPYFTISETSPQGLRKELCGVIIKQRVLQADTRRGMNNETNILIYNNVRYLSLTA